MQSKYQPRYDVECDPSGRNYTFHTEGGSTYILVFIPMTIFEDIPEDTLFVFNILRPVRGTSPDDARRISNTIAYVLERFFQTIENAILTTCDVDDGKQRSRKRLFDRWLHHHNDGRILTVTAKQNTGIGVTDATMYYRADNPFRFILEQRFREYIDLMNQLN